MPTSLQLFAGHPALDLVNTLDNRFLPSGTVETLHSYADLLGFTQQSKLLDASRIKALRAIASDLSTRQVMRSSLEMREALANVFYGSIDAGKDIAPSALRVLQTKFSSALRYRRLVQNTSSRRKRPLDATWTWEFPTRLELPIWLITQSAIALLTSGAMRHVHACANQRCRWLFLDGSKNHLRRWCNMSICGNRMKARRFHARRVDALSRSL
jgi:predicted RNA-binding Zn ribbon-like protein